MVTFALEPDERRRLDELGVFVDEEVVPVQQRFVERARHEARVIGEDGRIHPELVEASRAIRRRSAKEGFYAMHMPEEAGGAGLRRVATLEAHREVFERGMGLTLSVLASIEGPSRMLLALPEDQRERYLAPLVAGEATTCFALTEPGAGSDVKALETTARREGDEYVLNGTKVFITNGGYAAFSIVFARTGPPEDGYGAITAFLVDADAPGFRVGEAMETIANNGLPFALHFEDCRVPVENRIGEEGSGFLYALENINDIRMQVGGMCLGLARFCLDRAVDHARRREAFGRPISKFQGVSFPLADSLTELAMAHRLAQYAAWRIDEGEDAVAETSMTKLATTEMLWRVADRCVQAMGGAGVLRENEIERVLRWARVMRIFEGTSEIQRQTIAKTMGL